MADFRIEKDSLGQVQVPASAYYGAQTQRAVDNFPDQRDEAVSGLCLVDGADQARGG